MKLRLICARKEYDISIRMERERSYVTVNDREYEVSEAAIHGNSATFSMEGRRRTTTFARDNTRCHIALDGEYYVVELVSPSKSGPGWVVAEQENSVSSPMPGLLVKLFVKAGDRVKKGAAIAIVEAMKMQNELRSPLDGVVKDVNFGEGDQVDALKPIVHIEAE
jgi:biotin carboxyl carrier protein